MKKRKRKNDNTLLIVIILLILTLTVVYVSAKKNLSLRTLVKAVTPYNPSQQQSTFDLLSPTPLPISPTPIRFRLTTPTSTATNPPASPQNTTQNTTSSTQTDSAPVSGKQYCVDEDPGSVLIESCDDSTRCDIAHGAGGPAGSCGTVMGWEHSIIESLLSSSNNKFNNNLSDNLAAPIQSNCHTAAPYSPYISTFNVIDAYNLAGFGEFSRGTHASAGMLVSAWGTTTGYTVSTTANGLTPGDVVLFSNPAHVGIVNTVEIDARGNGDIWFLHTGAAYYLGKLMTANWSVVASSTGDTGVTFGSRLSKGADATTGQTVCYCGSICYQWIFK